VRCQLAVGSLDPVHLAHDTAGEHHVAAPRKGQDPDLFTEPGCFRGAGGHAITALGAEQGHVYVGGLAIRHHHGTGLRALTPLPAKEQVDRLLSGEARHGMAAREYEAVRAIGGAGSGGPGSDDHARARAETPAFRMLDHDLDGGGQNAREHVLAAGRAQSRGGAAIPERGGRDDDGQRPTERSKPR